jgi:chromosome segregation ATPase
MTAESDRLNRISDANRRAGLVVEELESLRLTVDRLRARGDENERLRGVAAERATEMEREVDTLRAQLAASHELVMLLTGKLERATSALLARKVREDDLRASLAAAQAEVERLREVVTRHDKDGDFWHGEASALKAEAGALREALRDIMACWGRDGNGIEHLLEGRDRRFYRALTAARAALAREPGEGDK